MVEALALTSEQRRKIADFVQQSLKKRREIDAQIAPLRRVIPDLLSQSVLDENEIYRTLATLDELWRAKRRDIVTMRMQVRQVLSAEQFHKLQELNPRIMRQPWITRPVQAEAIGKSPPERKEQPQLEEEEVFP